MPTDQPALPLRTDTILGVCEAIGEDFGFHPNILRVVFAALVLWNPVAILGIYLALGAVVAASRWFYPKVRPATVPAAEAVSAEPANAESELSIAA